jgi:septum site-determining protein MinC
LTAAAADLPPDLGRLRLSNRSFLALVMTPGAPAAAWFSALDREMARSPGFFAARPVVVDLAESLAAIGPMAPPILLEGLEARGLRVVAVEGVEPTLLSGTPWARLAQPLPGRDAPAEPETPQAASLLVDRPVRSGQSIVFEHGDVTVVGHVASGAEVIAGGSIHVYGALRGRAIAGLRTPDARIFCSRLEAELVGVERLYRVAEDWGPTLHGRAVQVACDRQALTLSVLD